MHKIHPILLLASFMLFLASCSTSKFFSGTASSIRPIALVQPYSYITDAIGDWGTKYLDDVSRVNEELIVNTLNSAGLPIEQTVAMDYNRQEASQLTSWMHKLGDLNAGSARDLVIPSGLRDAVTASGCRYGMVIVDLGYLKNSEQYALERTVENVGRVIDFFARNELSFGSDSEAFMNGIFGLVFDNKTGEVVWYGAQPRKYKKNPIDPRTISDQLGALLKDFR